MENIASIKSEHFFIKHKQDIDKLYCVESGCTKKG